MQQTDFQPSVQPSRHANRHWDSWSLGERIAMAAIASSVLHALSLIHWFGAV